MISQQEPHVKDYLELLKRYTEVKEYLDSTNRIAFNRYEVTTMLRHVLEGGGWL